MCAEYYLFLSFACLFVWWLVVVGCFLYFCEDDEGGEYDDDGGLWKRGKCKRKMRERR